MLRLLALILFVFTLAGCSRFGAAGAIPGGTLGMAPHITPEAARLKTILTFDGKNGAGPRTALTVVGGILYGTTPVGGTHNDGVLFSVTPSGKETILENFTTSSVTPEGPLFSVKGVLYGTTRGSQTNHGSVFAVKPDGTKLWTYRFAGKYNGRGPDGGLIEFKGALYGTTGLGGNPYIDAGAFYKITPSGKETPLYAFQGSPDGADPEGNLVAVGDLLYGTTSAGGPSGYKNAGTVFSVTRSGLEKVIHEFTYREGCEPLAGLVLLNGTLYGTTPSCGTRQGGTVFSITPAGKERVLYSFGGTKADGSDPQAPLLAYNGKLYGTTCLGGTDNLGTVFEIDTSGREKVLYSFTGGTDGGSPYAGLVQLNGVLYGMTPGLFSSYGTVFALTPQ